MARSRVRKASWAISLQRMLGAMARSSARAGAQAMGRALLPTPPRRAPRAAGEWTTGVALGPAGARRYRLFKPPGLEVAERLPLIVMLHGCGQDAEGFALSTRMNRLAARQRFLVLYPEQDRRANLQGCWNWFDTDTRRAYREAATLEAAVQQACLLYPVDRSRVAVAGLSAGASMAALLATRYPDQFRAVVMHSGVPPGSAHSTASALGAMRGRRAAALPSGPRAWPPLLVIHGRSDHVVAPSNGRAAAHLWADAAGARPLPSRVVQRGRRHAMTVSDFKLGRRIVATLCEVDGLGHAWSGGAAGQPYSDAKGPDASRMIWSFVARHFQKRALSI
jgi:poly(hydroxyalkanoate) depolymerase family esterase